jgi:hypothetical protein
MFPSVNGYFFIPTYGSLIAAINFDLSGTTRIGKYVLNHSFMIPGHRRHGCGCRHRAVPRQDHVLSEAIGSNVDFAAVGIPGLAASAYSGGSPSTWRDRSS